MALRLEIAAPERLVLATEIEMVVVPGEDGDFGVLEGHSPLISALRPGVVELHEGGRVSGRIFVAGGFAEAGPSGCTVLADEALDLAKASRGDAEARLQQAEARRREAETEAEIAKAEHGIETARALIEAL